MSALGLVVMRVLAVLPLSWIRALGWVLGSVLYRLAERRRRVGALNLRWCFPDASADQRRRWLRQHFVQFTQAWLDRSWLWYGHPRVLQRRLHWSGDNRALDEQRPVVLFAPHFVGLDAGWTALTLRCAQAMATIYTPQRDPAVDAWMLRGRRRFGDVQVCRREDGLLVLRSVLRRNGLIYLLPDLNHGREESVFVPLFGISAATVPSLSRLAKIGKAVVLPITTRLTSNGYCVQVGSVWPDFPTTDVMADTARMNRELEVLIRGQVSQYHWLHQRFKSRPDGVASPY